MPSQTQQLADDLDKLVDRYRAEYDLSYADVVGVLHMKAWLMCDEASRHEDDLEDESGDR